MRCSATFEIKHDITRDDLLIPAGTEVECLSEEHDHFIVHWERAGEDPVTFSVSPSELKVFDIYGEEET